MKEYTMVGRGVDEVVDTNVGNKEQDYETEVSMLTTIDNPFDPFDQFDEWLVWDNLHGYNTVNRLARLTEKENQTMSLAEEQEDINNAIDSIMANDFLGVYKVLRKKVKKNTDKDVE